MAISVKPVLISEKQMEAIKKIAVFAVPPVPPCHKPLCGEACRWYRWVKMTSPHLYRPVPFI